MCRLNLPTMLSSQRSPSVAEFAAQGTLLRRMEAFPRIRRREILDLAGWLEAKRSQPCHISHLTLLSNSLLQLFQVVQVNFQAKRLLGHPQKPSWCCPFSKLSREMIGGRLRNRRRKIRAPESSLLPPSSAFLRAPCFSVFDLTGLVALAMQKSQKVCF